MRPDLSPDLGVLAEFLDSDPAAEFASLSELDGILAAIAVGPDLIAPSEWLRLVLGVDGPVFDDTAQAQEILRAMMAHYNEVLRRIGSTPPEFTPVFFEGDEGEPIIDDWCQGFMSGVALRAESWEPFMRSRQNVFILPIIAHVPELVGEDFDPATMTDFEPELAIPVCVDKMYVYWRKRRAKRSGGDIVHLTRTPVRVASPPGIMAGRNDPCPCGSGKKFRKCCYATDLDA